MPVPVLLAMFGALNRSQERRRETVVWRRRGRPSKPEPVYTILGGPARPPKKSRGGQPKLTPAVERAWVQRIDRYLAAAARDGKYFTDARALRADMKRQFVEQYIEAGCPAGKAKERASADMEEWGFAVTGRHSPRFNKWFNGWKVKFVRARERDRKRR